MGDFLWHKVSEKEKFEIEKQAKEIMDNFSKELSKVKMTEKESLIEKGKCERVEKESLEGGSFSRETMFENAPSKNKDFILGEKKGW